jgi:uncharacterized protein Usg
MLPVIEPTVHVKVLCVLAVNKITGAVPLQVLTVAAVVTTGVGLTVTTILYALPGHVPVVDVGVTRYCTVPDEILPGFVRTWLIVLPIPEDEPVIPPDIDPTVHAKLPGTLDVSAIFGPVPLHIVVAAEFVTTGEGKTVTTILYGLPAHEPAVDVAVTRYSTVPEDELLAFPRTWFIVFPDPEVAPLILPVIAPTVQV